MNQKELEAFERDVEAEAYRRASHDGTHVPQQNEINAHKDTVRAEMRAARKDGGLFAPLKKVLSKLEAHKKTGEELEAEREEALRIQQTYESMLARREQLVAKIATGHERLRTVRASLDQLTITSTNLFLSDYDPQHGSNIFGAIESAYAAQQAGLAVVADEPRLKKEWQGMLDAVDAELAAFRKAHGL